MRRRPKALPDLLLLAASVACHGCAPASEPDQIAAHNVSMVRAYVDAATRGDTTYLDEYFAPDYTYHGPAGELDLDGFKALHRMAISAFPGATLSADAVIAAGDSLTATRWRLHGVHRGAFLGIEPTGKEVTLTGIIVSRFENGRVVEEWEEADMLGLMQQLGVVPQRER
jgi:predicted ester cyclase